MASGQWGGALTQRVFRATISFTVGGQRCQTGFHLRDVGLNTLDAEEVATEVSSFAQAQFPKILHSNGRLLGVDVENLVSREGHSISYSNIPGLVNGAPLPSFCTAAVAIKGSLRRRYGSGRMLWPVVDTSMITGNEVNANGLTKFDAVIADMLSRFVGPSITTSMHLVHLHPLLPAIDGRPEVPASWYDATSLRLNTRISSLRRRQQGVGL